MPSPTETLLRTQDSPVPTHTTFGFVGSMVTAPIDCTSGLSNTDLKVVPPFTDLQTPPLAAPANTVRRPWSSTASSAAKRPLITAEPMFLAGKPETDAESNFIAGCATALTATATNQNQRQQLTVDRRFLAELVAAIILKSSQSAVVTKRAMQGR